MRGKKGGLPILDIKAWLNSIINRKDFSLIVATFLITILIAFSNVLFPSSSSWERLLWNTAGYLALFGIYFYARLRPNDIGLSPKYFKKGFLYGISLVSIILIVLGVVYVINPEVFQDERYRQGLISALFAALILVPLKTVFFEELVFRGLLPALLTKLRSQRFAIIGSSLAFGLWHVSSSFGIGEYQILDITVPGFIFVIGAVVATSVAGLFFMMLRLKSGSLFAPILVHWFINGASIVLAAMSWQ